MLTSKIISGIQQIGIGVENLEEAWKWYSEKFGMNIRGFEDNTIADLMLPYTGGQPQQRHAALALNLQGGGGFEIWQYTNRIPQKPLFKITLGDLGIFAMKIKCKDILHTYEFMKSNMVTVSSSLLNNPSGEPYFFVKDPFNNFFQFVSGDHFFMNTKRPNGGVSGAIIGVSDIEKALIVYRDILGYDKILYDQSGVFPDLSEIPGGNDPFRRVLLTHSRPREGGFSKFLNTSSIELIKTENRIPRKIYEGRYWGDPGFIHLCFDIHGMDLLKEECTQKGFPFKIDSSVKHNDENSFDMGTGAAGHFTYIEDPDGTLIEFVETHKLAVFKSIGLYMNLRKRDPLKLMPDWMIKALRFNKVKFN